jgi:23S rRNA pseudouridine1911/1915/1917 synthase
MVDLPILFEDEHIVVVQKSPGLLSVPDRFNAALPNVRAIARQQYGDIWMVHRLDRDTSGVMVLAKTADAHRSLSMQFEQHSITKLYTALVKGVVATDEFPITIPIAPDPRKKGLMKPSAKGKEAHTIVRVLERFRLASLLECKLVTGRQHQIRVHCAAVGHALLVDKDYGSSSEFLLSTIKKRYNLAKNTEERAIMSRHSLHATTIGFLHPANNMPVEYSAPFPKDFAALLQVLRKYSAPYSSAFEQEFW